MSSATFHRHSIGLLAASVITGAAFSQEQLERYEPVEAGVADVDPLSTSLRDLRFDLRTPADFDRVYRVPGHPDLLMRVHGSLFAVFPLSVYERTRFGAVPVVPNNTVFYIGEDSLRDLAVTSANAAPVPNGVADRIDLRAVASASIQTNGRVEEPRKQTPPARERSIAPLPTLAIMIPDRDFEERPAVSPDIVSDASYRGERLRNLMRRAAQAARGRSSSSK